LSKNKIAKVMKTKKLKPKSGKKVTKEHSSKRIAQALENKKS